MGGGRFTLRAVTSPALCSHISFELSVIMHAGGLLAFVIINKYVYVSPPYCRAKMYAGRVTCCPLVSHVDYASY